MIKPLINYLKKYKQKRLWRKLNPHNDTVMGSFFDTDIVSVGKYSYGILNVISYNSIAKLRIGSFCSIAPNVTFVLNGEHRTDCLSTYPFKAHCVANPMPEAGTKGSITIDDDVWIGTGSYILSGVHIGRGAVIAAGSIVTKDIEAYSIVAGVPARTVRKRFSEEIIDSLMELDFEKLDQETIESHLAELYTPVTDESQFDWLKKDE